MSRLLLFPLAAAALLIASAAGCSDDEGNGRATETPAAEATLGEYIAQVDEIQDGVSDVVDDLGVEQAFADPAAARASVSGAIDVAESAVAALGNLKPPATAQAAHAELISAAENLVDIAQALNEDLEGAEPGPDFDEIKEEAQAAGSDLSRALDRVRQACQEMVQVAEANMINVELACPEAR